MRAELPRSTSRPSSSCSSCGPREVELSRDGRAHRVHRRARRAASRASRCRRGSGPATSTATLAPVGDDGASQALPRFSPDGARLAFASDRGHAGRMSLRVDERRARRDRRLGRGDRVVARRPRAARARRRPRLRPRGRGERDEDPGGGRGRGGPGRAAARAALAAALARRRRPPATTREVSPEGVNVFEFGWAGGKVAAVCTDEPSESAWYDAWIGLLDLDCAHRRARPHAAVAAAVPADLAGRTGSPGSRASRPTAASCRGTVHVLGRGPLAPELDVTWIDFAGEDDALVRGLARRRLVLRPTRARRLVRGDRAAATS